MTHLPQWALYQPQQSSQMLHDLGVAMGQHTTQVANLSTTTNISVHTAAQAMKLAVAQPKPWNRKGGSVEARFFLAAFFNYARSEGEALNDWDVTHSQWMRTTSNGSQQFSTSWRTKRAHGHSPT